MTDGIDKPDSYFPKVSVIVPIYNGEQDLPGLLKCLMAQHYPAQQVEYLLVDNGSRDRTPALLAEAVNTFATKGLTCNALSEPNIQSSYAARNVGICAAQGEFLAFTDADCYPDPNWLIELMQPFVDCTVGLVAGKISALPGKTWIEQYSDCKDTLSQEHTLNHAFAPYGQTANLGIRMEALKQVGLFRPHLTTGGDADICWRIQASCESVGPSTCGIWQIRSAPAAIIQHRHRQTLQELRAQWYRYGKSNRYLHELHGIQLAWQLPKKEERRALLRWGLKDLPRAIAILLCQQRLDIDKLIGVPADIYCARARDLGQKEAALPAAAREIVAYPSATSHVETKSPEPKSPDYRASARPS